MLNNRAWAGLSANTQKVGGNPDLFQQGSPKMALSHSSWLLTLPAEGWGGKWEGYWQKNLAMNQRTGLEQTGGSQWGWAQFWHSSWNSQPLWDCTMLGWHDGVGPLERREWVCQVYELNTMLGPPHQNKPIESLRLSVDFTFANPI